MNPPESDAERPIVAAVAQVALASLRSQARIVAIFMALALFTFVYFCVGEGRPLWLVLLIGFFGVILIGLFIALCWFWRRFADARGKPR